jgi:hypothetical protein
MWANLELINENRFAPFIPFYLCYSKNVLVKIDKSYKND